MESPQVLAQPVGSALACDELRRRERACSGACGGSRGAWGQGVASEFVYDSNLKAHQHETQWVLEISDTQPRDQTIVLTIITP
eukprot:2809475-Amphidinium_carterae.1